MVLDCVSGALRLIENWYETVRFERAMHCESCGILLARRASMSPVVDGQGNPIEVGGVGLDYDPRADYRLQCSCGHNMEFSSPEDAEQMKATSFEKCTAPIVVRLT